MRVPSDDERGASLKAWRRGSALRPVSSSPLQDPADRLIKEGQLPANMDPSNPLIDESAERSRIMRTFERALGKPAGYVLPVAALGRAGQARLDQRAVAAAPWPPVPGAGRFADRAAPAAELAASSGAHRLPAHGAGRSVRAALPLPDPAALEGMAAEPHDTRAASARAGDRMAGETRTLDRVVPQMRPAAPPPPAIPARGFRCAPRSRSSRATASSVCSCRRSSGSRIIWSLIEAAEATAAELGTPIRLEGYPPPHDPRNQRHQGDAGSGRDRGQHHPSASWQEAVETTTVLYSRPASRGSAPTSS